MNSVPGVISICIPAYKRPQNIDRLLHSISIQKQQPFEVIITDDSPDTSVHTVVQKYAHLPIKYFRNEKPMGTPANWNYGISLAQGEWIKIMHDDDWFANETALEQFAGATKEGKKFIAARYYNIFSDGRKEMPSFPEAAKKRILTEPVSLLIRNVIGPPSVTLIHRSVQEKYDERMKWRVDMDYYMRLLKKYKTATFLNQPLICVGISATQVTNDCLNIPEVELPEGLLLLQKYGLTPLKKIMIYDAWWRIIRNVNVRSKNQLLYYTPGAHWPRAILKMVQHQSLVPGRLLKWGVVSKAAMAVSYLVNRKNLTA